MKLLQKYGEMAPLSQVWFQSIDVYVFMQCNMIVSGN